MNKELLTNQGPNFSNSIWTVKKPLLFQQNKNKHQLGSEFYDRNYTFFEKFFSKLTFLDLRTYCKKVSNTFTHK